MWPVTPSAGFWGGTSWLDTHANLVKVAQASKGPIDVLLVGDSITMQWGAAWTKHFPTLKTVNIGIGGDKSQNVLWRLDHGGVEGLEPRLCVLLIGNNNMFFTPETGIEPAAQGIKVCVDRRHRATRDPHRRKPDSTSEPASRALLTTRLHSGNPRQRRRFTASAICRTCGRTRAMTTPTRRQAADGLYNTELVIHRGRLLGFYDKVILTPGDRDSLGFKPGNTVPVFQAHGARFAVIICADTSYPHVALAARLQGAELLFAPHNNQIDAVAADDHRHWVRNCHVGLACQLKMVVARANNVGQRHFGGNQCV